MVWSSAVEERYSAPGATGPSLLSTSDRMGSTPEDICPVEGPVPPAPPDAHSTSSPSPPSKRLGWPSTPTASAPNAGAPSTGSPLSAPSDCPRAWCATKPPAATSPSRKSSCVPKPPGCSPRPPTRGLRRRHRTKPSPRRPSPRSQPHPGPRPKRLRGRREEHRGAHPPPLQTPGPQWASAAGRTSPGPRTTAGPTPSLDPRVEIQTPVPHPTQPALIPTN